MPKTQSLITKSYQQQKKASTRSSKRHKNKPKTDTKHDADKNVASTSRSRADILRQKELGILRKFDVKMKYGPCTGITRLERWIRADKNGLKPPDAIRQLILTHKDDEEYTNNLWHDYAL